MTTQVKAHPSLPYPQIPPNTTYNTYLLIVVFVSTSGVAQHARRCGIMLVGRPNVSNSTVSTPQQASTAHHLTPSAGTLHHLTARPPIAACGT